MGGLPRGDGSNARGGTSNARSHQCIPCTTLRTRGVGHQIVLPSPDFAHRDARDVANFASVREAQWPPPWIHGTSPGSAARCPLDAAVRPLRDAPPQSTRGRLSSWSIAMGRVIASRCVSARPGVDYTQIRWPMKLFLAVVVALSCLACVASLAACKGGSRLSTAIPAGASDSSSDATGTRAEGASPSSGDASDDVKASAGDAGTSPGTYLLYEKFNEMAADATPDSPWVAHGSATVREVPFAADKSVEIAMPPAAAATDAGANTSASLSVTLPEQSGRVVFEAKVLALETAGFKAIPYIYDSSGNAVASVEFQDGNDRSRTSAARSRRCSRSSRTSGIACASSSIPRRGTFDLFVDGVRKVEHAISRCARRPARSPRSDTTSTARTRARCASTTSRSTPRPRSSARRRRRCSTCAASARPATVRRTTPPRFKPRSTRQPAPAARCCSRTAPS